MVTVNKPPPQTKLNQGYKIVGDTCHKLIPIIFIPGIAGTKIFDNGIEVWPAVGTGLQPLTGMNLEKDGRTFVNPVNLK